MRCASAASPPAFPAPRRGPRSFASLSLHRC